MAGLKIDNTDDTQIMNDEEMMKVDKRTSPEKWANEQGTMFVLFINIYVNTNYTPNTLPTIIE